MSSINDRLEELNEPFAAFTGTYTLACECSASWCEELLTLPTTEAIALRRHPGARAVSPQHVDMARFRVVGRHDGYVVVLPR